MIDIYKKVRLFPYTIKSIKDFVVEHPVYVPGTPKYESYWIEQAKYAVYGKWGHDGNGYRWMPPDLYFYINMCVIKDQDDEMGMEIETRPQLRDLEWYMFYLFQEADGFSGFDGDDEYTCYEIIKKIENGEKLSKKEEILLEKHHHFVTNSKGAYKKYRSPREYLFETKSKPLGNPTYLNERKDILILGSRGFGKSFSVAGKVAHEFCTYGAKTLDAFLNKKSQTTIVVGAEDTKYSDEFLEKFEAMYEYIRRNVGAYHKDGHEVNGVFWYTYEGSLRNTTGKPFTTRVSLKGGKGKTTAGSKIVHVNYKNNPQAAVGHRARLIVVEEVGLLANFKDVRSANDAVQKRKTKFGYSIYIGTGGNVKKIEQVRKAFYKPEANNLIAVEDEFTGSKEKIGVFIPAYYRNNLFRDEFGNLDIDSAFDEEVRIRKELYKKDKTAYEDYALSYPMIPSEMFLSNEGAVFDVYDIMNRIAYLESGGYEASHGMLHYVDDTKTTVYWTEDLENKYPKIIRFGDEKDLGNLETCYNIYEHPKKYISEDRATPLYITLYDPVHRDESGSSLAVAFVFKFFDYDDYDSIQFNVVAEWIGRTKFVEDAHERVLKLARYYNSKILFDDSGDFKRYCRMTGRLGMLQRTPNFINENYMSKKTDYGIKIVPGMRPDLEMFANDLLRTIVRKDEVIKGNKYFIKNIRMQDEIRSFRLLEELLYYRRQGNYDYVSALFLLALYVRGLNLDKNHLRKEEEKEEVVSKYIEFMKNAKLFDYVR